MGGQWWWGPHPSKAFSAAPLPLGGSKPVCPEEWKESLCYSDGMLKYTLSSPPTT